MELILFLILFSSVAYSFEQAKKEWRHHRDGHARDIQRSNPDWHPRKVRRHARGRALRWWGQEIAGGFPHIRRAWAEDRDHVRYLRETDRIGRDTRIAELRTELAAIRQGREEHEAAAREGRTKAPFGPWYQEHAPRIRRGEPDPDRPVFAPPPTWDIQPFPLSPADAAGDFPEETAPAAAEPAGEPPGGPVPSRTEAADEFYAAVTEGRNEAAASAHRQYHDARPGETAGDRAPQAPGQRAGGHSYDTRTEGDDMTASTSVPSGELAGDSPYRAAFTALEQYDQVAQQHEASAETLEAQMTIHGFDRDPQLMQHIRGLREAATTVRTHTANARQTLTANHGQGDEYHRSGTDANASAFRNG